MGLFVAAKLMGLLASQRCLLLESEHCVEPCTRDQTEENGSPIFNRARRRGTTNGRFRAATSTLQITNRLRIPKLKPGKYGCPGRCSIFSRAAEHTNCPPA